MEINNTNCVKIKLPNGKVADILSPVIATISRWIQDSAEKPESGGYIVGYQHQTSENISLEAVSPPFPLDSQTRIHFEIRDPKHILFLKRAKQKKSYYMGVWHTHPQADPAPSSVDWEDWIATMNSDKTGSRYVFFIIAGTVFWRIWVGDMETKEIIECEECAKDLTGIYFKEGKADESIE